MIDEIHIPGYDLQEFIAKGGMSSVYRAKQHIFERNIALKIMRQDLSDEGNFIERFMQESLIVAKLHHSHIVQVYDVGEVSDHCFIAMEFLSGGVLKAKMAEGLSIKKSVSILKQIASALDFAHQKGIVHRDIKPDNIMFREDGAAVLTDFGIAKDRSADMELTQTGAIMGTPKYMAPEQIKGEVIEPATDLYSLGIVFYEMLTGFVPFQGSDFVSIAHKHLTEPAPPLTGNLSNFQPIMDKLLAKEANQRFGRAGEIYLALDELAEFIANPEVENTVIMNASSSHFTAGTYDSLSGEVKKGQSPYELAENPSKSAPNTDLPIDVAPTNIYIPKTAKQKHTPWSLSKQLLDGKPLVFGVAAACLVVIIGGGIGWQMTTTPEESSPIGEPSNPIISAENPMPVQAIEPVEQEDTQSLNISTLLTDARADIRNSRLTRPENRNALAKYRQVLELDENNVTAKNGIEEIAQLIAGRGAEQLKQDNVTQAQNLLTQAQTISSDNQSVKNLQLDIDSRLNEIANTQQNILSMREEIQIDGLLGIAESDVKAGRINAPPGNNAVERYQQVLRIDPNNKIAKEKLAELN